LDFVLDDHVGDFFDHRRQRPECGRRFHQVVISVLPYKGIKLPEGNARVRRRSKMHLGAALLDQLLQRFDSNEGAQLRDEDLHGGLEVRNCEVLLALNFGVADQHSAPAGNEEGVGRQDQGIGGVDVKRPNGGRGDVQHEVYGGEWGHSRGKIPLGVVDEPCERFWSQEIILLGL